MAKGKNLTDQGVSRLRPPTDKQYANHYDAIVPGLVLRVSSGGAKAWVVRHYRKGLNEKTGKRTLIPTTHRIAADPQRHAGAGEGPGVPW